VRPALQASTQGEAFALNVAMQFVFYMTAECAGSISTAGVHNAVHHQHKMAGF
jgi:hypothetical protein